MVSGVCQKAAAQEKTKYYVAIVWLYNDNDYQEERPCVSNVVKLTCRYQNTDAVSNQFHDFFNAFVKNRRGYNISPGGITVFRYDTYDEAEKQRRKWIADYNNSDWDTLLVHDFSVLCDD